jgi:hypothetical protein
MYLINKIFGTIYCFLFIISIFTQDNNTTFYSQAFLIGYCLNCNNICNLPIPLWVVLSINSFNIIYDSSLWFNTMILFIEWIHFIVILSLFLIRSKKCFLNNKQVDTFNYKLLLFIVFVFDCIVDPYIGNIILIILYLQYDNPYIDMILIVNNIIHTIILQDYYNTILSIVLIFYIYYNGRNYSIRSNKNQVM